MVFITFILNFLVVVQAELADRDFTADQGQPVVVSTGTAAMTALDAQKSKEERRMAEEKNKEKLCIPRRPPWNHRMTADELDAQERQCFLEWRRNLAELESDARLVLTPFEKNLNVWRQLWRVIERSDVVVQVVDARDPLTYWNDDLKNYCLELSPTKKSILLMNKSDMIPEKLRVAWADYFDEHGIDYLFWSAKQASEEDGCQNVENIGSDKRARLQNVDTLIQSLQERAAIAVDKSSNLGNNRQYDRLMVGLIGYPNVGKSSTINALFGSKKTAVAATPGKTKHFQTLFVSDELCLCDCPGLVMPRFAHSKADMVAAGVIPIDRLTDVIEPVDIIVDRAGLSQLGHVYGIKIPLSSSAKTYPRARSLLYALAASRGWSVAGGLPDMTRAGRRVLKDFVDGKILAAKAPPDAPADIQRLADRLSSGSQHLPQSSEDLVAAVSDQDESEAPVPSPLEDDLLFTEESITERKKATRPAYKFHKKMRKSKVRGTGHDLMPVEDSFAFGKKGGMRK